MLDVKSRFTCDKSNVYYKVVKFQNIMPKIIDLIGLFPRLFSRFLNLNSIFNHLKYFGLWQNIILPFHKIFWFLAKYHFIFLMFFSMSLTIHIYNDNKIMPATIVIETHSHTHKKNYLNCSETAALK